MANPNDPFTPSSPPPRSGGGGSACSRTRSGACPGSRANSGTCSRAGPCASTGTCAGSVIRPRLTTNGPPKGGPFVL